ncbi:MAG: hypothetical protein GY839_09710 [candidate division Zixibacteria bacterium]|nr:hypothetical protein [candidate division Zixibacteria bacterium]
MLERASRTNSIGHVIAHENRHLQQFRSHARYQGKEIIRENISVRYEFVDGKITAVAGEATALMRDKPEDELKLDGEAPKKSAIDVEAELANEDDQKKRKLDVILARVDAALNRLGNKLEKAEKDEGGAYDIDQNRIAELRGKKAELEDKKKEIIKKRNMLNAEKLEEMTKELLSGLGDLIDQAANLFKAIYGLKSGQQIEQDSDKKSSSYDVSIPDYSMLYTGMLLDTIV